MNRGKSDRVRSAGHGRRLGLRGRLILPFLIVLLLLAMISGTGIFAMLKASLIENTDERLQTTREILYREFKKRETILKTYTVFLQQFQNLANHYPEDPEISILQEKLLQTLADANITVSFYPLDDDNMPPAANLKGLFEQARRSGEPRFRYTNDFGAIPVLMVAAPLYQYGRPRQIILLQTPMGENFLYQATAPLHVKSSLHNLDGEILARSEPGITPFLLKEKQLVALSSGEQIFLDHTAEMGHRHLLTAIPLGTSDLVFLSLEAVVSIDTPFVRRLAMQMALGIFLAILLGGLLYLRTVNAVVQPVRDIRAAMETAAGGNLSRRLRLRAAAELEDLAQAYNQMCASLQEIFSRQPGNIQEIETARMQLTRSQLLLEKKQQELTEVREEARVHQRETMALLQLNQAMISSPGLDVLFNRILQVLNELLGCDHIVLLLYNPGESLLEVAHASGVEEGALNNVTFAFDQGICGQVGQSKRLIYVKNLARDDRNLSYYGQIATRGSLVSAPMVVKDRLIGVLNLHKLDIEAFSASELKLIQAAANQAAIAIDNTHLFEKSLNTAVMDSLTGLYNRRFFQDTLKREAAQARRFGTNFSTIMCDIDHLGQFNETHGRMRGDALIRQVCHILLKTTRGIDMVGRFGNQQFAILLPRTDRAGAVKTAEKLRMAILGENFSGADQSQPEGRITMSFGVSEFPTDSKNIYELLNMADRALYAAKQQGRNRTVAWQKELETSDEPDN